MANSWLSLLLLAVCAVVQAAPPKKLPGPYTIFKTEPTFIPNAINITNNNHKDLLAPGYIFIAPHIKRIGYGPQIVDQEGHLVWYGNPTVTKIKDKTVYGMNFYVCDYLGEKGTHLCYSEARPHGDSDQGIRQGGANRIFGNDYEPVVEDFTQIGNLTYPNPHEFHMLPGGEFFLQTLYYKREMDLTPYGGHKKGYIFDGCFQEIAIRNRSVMFQWCVLDHVPVWETYLFLHIPDNNVNFSSPTGGRGIADDPWDYVHMNSVDKNIDGNYLISSRHLSSLFLIAGNDNAGGHTPGKILWKLAGKDSTIKYPPRLLFTRQHHARFISVGHTETQISLFNNGWDGHTHATRNQSSSMIITVNNQSMTSDLNGLYESPKWKLSVAQGSTQVLPNGNIFSGWGTKPWYTEFHPNGTLLYHAETYINATRVLSNYRAYKMPWVGKPTTKPKLVAYCQTCRAFSLTSYYRTTPLVAYVSWNGATEVTSWRFALSAMENQKTWVAAGTFPKTGFETECELNAPLFAKISPFPRWVSVEALDKDGNILETTIEPPFVPNIAHREKCGLRACFDPVRFHYSAKYNRARLCNAKLHSSFNFIVLCLLIVACESATKFYSEIMTNPLDSPMARRRRRTLGSADKEAQAYDVDHLRLD